MYEIYVLIRTKWHFVERANSIHELDIAIKYIYNKYPDKTLQVIKDDKEFCTLDGSDYHYFIFYNKYILRQPINFDYVKEYEKVKKFRKF